MSNNEMTRWGAPGQATGVQRKVLSGPATYLTEESSSCYAGSCCSSPRTPPPPKPY
ncbi:hypothetical protein TSUD_382910 [Trifolium subterraneum]|uniref:Uncharacterized protein n=1 Tax=Trifolium subterraneum TaxID=3900 RepID=A0A2Z6NRN7_TRISU|nr:hypothetical protein TSUD_382910 [Trifolium subterraneum]